jgi:hypothetical protein
MVSIETKSCIALGFGLTACGCFLKEIYEFYQQFGLRIHQSAIFIPTPHPDLIRLIVITASSSICKALSGFKKYFNH